MMAADNVRQGTHPRIDAHQHYWRVARGDYGWMDGAGLEVLRRDFLPADLAPELAQHGITHTIAVQAAPTQAETDFLLELAEANPTIAGVVGWLDLESRDFARVLGEYRSRPKFVGLRPMLQDLADDAFIVRPQVLEGLAQLAKAELTLDLLILPRHLEFAARALEVLPSLRAVVDHCAKPAIAPRRAARGEATRELDAWRDGMERLASNPLVSCKISGLVTETGPDWTASDLAPVIEHVLVVFGPDRVLFGSDWPVCTLKASYDRVVGVLHEVLGQRLSGEFEQKFFGSNAEHAYELVLD